MAKTPEKLGILGGTFDPVHLGHLIIGEAALEHAGLDTLLMLPSSSPPHKMGPCREPEASFAHRLAMTEAAVAGDGRFEVSDLEGKRAGPSYTVDVLEQVRREKGAGVSLFFLIGADWIHRLSTWKEIDAVFEKCTFLLAPRPGYDRGRIREEAKGLRPAWVDQLEAGWFPAPRIEISSTDVRHRLDRGLSVRYRVPPAVEDHIRRHGLYGTGRPDCTPSP